MLRYSIKARGMFLDAMDKLTHRRQQRVSNPVSIPVFTQDVALNVAGWDKLRFNLWYNKEVANKFKVGDLICSSFIPVRANNVPFHWKVEYINETYNTARLDHIYKEPNVLHCRGFKDEWIYKCPSTVRHLTEEELELVHLQNSKPQGTA